MSHPHHFSNRTKGNEKGFSLVELVVSIGIAAIILSVIVFNQSSYAEAAALGNLADEVALTVNQAQAYGIAVRERVAGSADFSGSYGLSLSLLGQGSPTEYLFFIDRNANQSYDGDWACETGGTAECLSKTEFLGKNYLDSICILKSAGPPDCMSIRRADVSFLRPSLEARITFFNAGGVSVDPPNDLGVKFVLKSAGGLTRSVLVYKSGQVSVQ